MLSAMTCAHCGDTFTTSRPTMARTCSNACRVAMCKARRIFRQKQADAARAEAWEAMLAHGALVRESISSGVAPDPARLGELAAAADEAAARAEALLRRR